MVGGLDILADGFFQFPCEMVHGTADMFFGLRREPTLHKIEPGRAARREVHMKVRMAGQPAMNERCPGSRSRLVFVVVSDTSERRLLR